MQSGRYKHSLRATFKGKLHKGKRRDSLTGNPLLEERRSSQSFNVSTDDTTDNPDDPEGTADGDGDGTENPTDGTEERSECDITTEGDATEDTTDTIEDSWPNGTAEEEAPEEPTEDAMEEETYRQPKFKSKKFSSNSSSSGAASSRQEPAFKKKNKGLQGLNLGTDMPGMEGLGTDFTAVCPSWEGFSNTDLNELAQYGII